MKTVTLTLALISCIAIQHSEAQSSNYADSVINLKVSVINNSNMTFQVPTVQNILFLADSTNTAAIIAIGNDTTYNAYVYDPAVAAFPFSSDGSGNPPRLIDVKSGLNQFYSINFGFSSSLSATISVTAKFDSIPTGNYVAFLKRMSTGEVFSILNDTITLVVPANTNYATDFILLVGPAVEKTANNETCYGDGLGGVRMICQGSNWNYKLYNNSNQLLRQGSVYVNDTTFSQFPQGQYSITTIINHMNIDSGSFVVSGPAPIIAAFTVSDYAPITNTVVDFINASTGSITYDWDFGDGFTDNQVNTSHGYLFDGVYIITLTAHNLGCSQVVTDSIQVYPATMISNPGGPIHELVTNPIQNSSIRLGKTSELTVATDLHKLTISVPETKGEMKIEIRNANGQLIFSKQSEANSFETEVEKSGVYLLRVTFANGEIITRSIVVL